MRLGKNFIANNFVGVAGLSLTIPFAMLFDFIFNGVTFSWTYFFGSLLVITGFALVNYSFVQAEAEEAATVNLESSVDLQNPTTESSQHSIHSISDDEVMIDANV
jgi:hypothetical protein